MPVKRTLTDNGPLVAYVGCCAQNAHSALVLLLYTWVYIPYTKALTADESGARGTGMDAADLKVTKVHDLGLRPAAIRLAPAMLASPKQRSCLGERRIRRC